MEILQGLDADQELAVRSSSNSSLVTAGAGTGKTRTLTARIAHLIVERGIPADQITAVTFTNRAANELRERITANLGPLAAGLRLGTFHGLSNRILRRHAEYARLRSGSFEIIDEDMSRELMTHAVRVPGAFGTFRTNPSLTDSENEGMKREFEANQRGFVSRALSQVSLWKSSGLTDEEAGDPSRAARSEQDERFAAAYCAYQYELESRNMVDFGDLILKTVMVLRKHEDIRLLEAGRIVHMLVDEAQDADFAQVEWVRLLTSVHGGLTVVGDEDQNIYGFKGGYPGAMKDMAGPSTAEFTLRTNRRCTEEILKPAVTIVGYNRRKGKKELFSGRHGDPVRVTGHPTDANEAAWVAGRVAEMIEGGASPSQIAILFRTSFAMAPFEEALARKGVSAKVCSGTSLLDREEVRDVLALLRLALNPFDELSFVRIASKLSKGLGAVAVDAISALAKARDIPLHEACAVACEPSMGLALKKPARTSAARLAAALQVIAEEGRWGSHPHDIITTALRETAYFDVVAGDEKADDRKANVEALHRLSEGFQDPSAFLQEMALLTDIEDMSEADLKKVRLLTIHASKGLEFDHVFCPSFDDGIMPSQRSVDEGRKGKPGDLWNGPQGGGLEEERRLAHVAFTRARHTLDVSFPWQRRSRGQKPVKKSKSGGPSSFLEECAFVWKEVGPASSAELGLKKTAKKTRAERLGFDRD
ncbi:ATP-dependent helicase [Agrobacterium rubi]|nr:ATP-dependent helicase [Agrobacterium rubi]NTF24272.1 ATP-dependent helicase [Agrobacterium rubi]